MNPSTIPGAPAMREATAALQAQRPYFIQAIALSVIAGVLQLAPSWYMFEVYGRVMDSRNLTTMALLLLCVVGVNVVVAVLEYTRGNVLRRASEQVDECLRQRLFNAAFEANLRRAPGGSPQIFIDLRVVREFIASPALTTAMDLPASLIFLVLMFLMSPWLGCMVLVGLLIQVVLAVLTERRTMPQLTQASIAATAANNYAAGSLRNASVIEAMGMMKGVHRRWLQKQRQFLSLQSSASDYAGVNASLAKLVQTMQGSLLLGAACLLLLQGNLNGGSGMMIIASIIGAKVLSPLAQLVTQWRSIVGARDAYGRLSGLLAQFPERPRGMPLPAPSGQLSVEGLTAGAPGSTTPILRNVSIALQPGDALGVIGAAASGKTTLARLLVGVWPAMAGKVRLDGADVHSWHKDELGPHVGYLPQTVELFEGTVAENIARFGKVDTDRVRAAVDQVGMAEIIEALPQGLDTPIGDEGAVLSGGQRQRIALARALYGDPSLIVLDEPNASLDEAGEKALIKAIEAAKARGATVIAITHRTTLMPALSKLLVLRDGQSIAFGPRDDVLAALKKAADMAREKAEGRPAAAAMPRLAPKGTT